MLRLAAARPLARAAARSVVAPRVRCMHDDFKPQTKSYAAPSITVHEQIQKDIDTDPVVVFMKGVPDAPMCGFSNTVVQIMKAEGVSFKGYNVLASPELREGIKEFSSWPTIPQVSKTAAAVAFQPAARHSVLVFATGLHQGRVHWRVRRHDGDVQVGRAAEAAPGCGPQGDRVREDVSVCVYVWQCCAKL